MDRSKITYTLLDFMGGNMPAIRNIIFAALLCTIFISSALLADGTIDSPDSIRTLAPKVFVDCPNCDH